MQRLPALHHRAPGCLVRGLCALEVLHRRRACEALPVKAGGALVRQLVIGDRARFQLECTRGKGEAADNVRKLLGGAHGGFYRPFRGISLPSTYVEGSVFRMGSKSRGIVSALAKLAFRLQAHMCTPI